MSKTVGYFLIFFLAGILSPSLLGPWPTVVQAEKGKGKKSIIRVDSALQAGSVTLEPGRYQVQHVFEGAQHFMSFRRLSVYPDGRIGEVGKEVLRAKCTMVLLDKKAERTELLTRGKSLKEVRVEGETVTHLF